METDIQIKFPGLHSLLYSLYSNAIRSGCLLRGIDLFTSSDFQPMCDFAISELMALSKTNEYGSPNRANTDQRHFLTFLVGQLFDPFRAPTTVMRKMPTCCLWALFMCSRSHGALLSHVPMDLSTRGQRSLHLMQAFKALNIAAHFRLSRCELHHFLVANIPAWVS